MTTSTIPRETFDQMREALKQSLYVLEVPIVSCQKGVVQNCKCRKCVIERGDEALTAAKAALSHQNPETTPAPEGGAITAENGKAVTSECSKVTSECSEHVPEVGFGKIVGTYGKVMEWPSMPEPQAQEGWKWVPVEPTQEMCNAARWSEYGEETSRQYDVSDEFIKSVWDSLLAAAPAPKEEG